MDEAQKVVQYLREARASEDALVRVLQSQIAMAPAGSYRSGLEAHLVQTRDHSRRVGRRIAELGGGRDPVGIVVGVAEQIAGQVLALSKTPLDLIRGSGGAEKVLKNAKDGAAAEALEIATYTAIQRLAETSGDRATAELARSVRADEERMLARLTEQIPGLVDALTGHSPVAGDIELGEPGEPWPGYDELTVADVRSRLSGGDADLATAVRGYERRHRNRTGVVAASERRLRR